MDKGRCNKAKRKIFIVTVLFVSNVLFASGSLQVSPGYHFESGKVLSSAGLSIYELIGLGLYYDSYTGIGNAPRVYQPTIFWVASRHDIEKSFGDLTVGVGATLRIMLQDGFKNENENNAHVTLSYKIW